VKNIKVNISGREYPVNVTPETAAAMKKAAEMVNEQAKQFQTAYAITDPRDLLAMCALQLAYQNLEYTDTFSESVEEKLSAIESALDIEENT
jgi:cell division protein ZapA (FtsZ GTPase activity inhibitor)